MISLNSLEEDLRTSLYCPMKEDPCSFSPRSAYLHIPFCHRRCFYCDFVVVPIGDKASPLKGPGSKLIKSYLKLLHREINISPSGPPLSTIYFGGGTPSLLSPCQIKGLLQHLREHFGIQEGCEITLEIDPSSFDEKKLEGYINVGINRLSLGAQNFDDSVLKSLGRRHTGKDVKESCRLINKAYETSQIVSWSLDLIQNLPGENLINWGKQLSQAIETSPPHLSIYDLSIEPGTIFSIKERRGELNLPQEDLAADISLMTNSVLGSFGYKRYEISNYSLPGHLSRHNRVYWNGSGWWAFGQGATSSPWGERFSRPKTRDSYQDWIEQQELKGVHSSLHFNSAAPLCLEDLLMVGLRRREGVNLEKLAHRMGWDNDQSKLHFDSLLLRLRSYFGEDILQNMGKTIRLTDPKGMEISNQVLVEMFLWWESLNLDSVCLSNL